VPETALGCVPVGLVRTIAGAGRGGCFWCVVGLAGNLGGAWVAVGVWECGGSLRAWLWACGRGVGALIRVAGEGRWRGAGGLCVLGDGGCAGLGGYGVWGGFGGVVRRPRAA